MTTTTEEFFEDLSDMLRPEEIEESPEDPEEAPEEADYRAWVDREMYWQHRQLSAGW